MKAEDIKVAQEKFGELLKGEEPRIEAMKESSKPTDFEALDKIVVGVLPRRWRRSDPYETGTSCSE